MFVWYTWNVCLHACQANVEETEMFKCFQLEEDVDEGSKSSRSSAASQATGFVNAM